jgi:phosphoribosylglycinamide formyltransferase 1
VSFRIAVLISGEGSNLQALIADLQGSEIEIVGVVSSRAEAYGLERAEAAGIETAVFSLADEPERERRDDALAAWLEERRVELVVLAGFMELLTPGFIRRFPGRIINVHPALLPAFPGDHAVADALAYGAKVTGVTVHLVDEDIDHGPVVFQEAVEVRGDDVWDTLEPRIHAVEHRLLPAALRALVEGRLKVEGRRVHVLEGEP